MTALAHVHLTCNFRECLTILLTKESKAPGARAYAAESHQWCSVSSLDFCDVHALVVAGHEPRLRGNGPRSALFYLSCVCGWSEERPVLYPAGRWTAAHLVPHVIEPAWRREQLARAGGPGYVD